jgi:hypothetical protein
VGERVGHDRAGLLALQAVVADRRGGVECFLDVAWLEPLVLLLREVGPHAGVAVGLQLLAHQQPVVALDLRAARAQLRHLLGHAGDGLHVVADLVRDHVRLREVAAGAHARGHLVEERRVDVDLLVAGAVERPDRRGRAAARRCHHLREQHQRRRRILLACLREDLAPHVLGGAEHRADQLRRLGGRRRRPGLPGRRRLRLDLAQQLERVLAEQEGHDQHEHQPADAQSAHAHAADALAAAVLHIGALSSDAPLHGHPP